MEFEFRKDFISGESTVKVSMGHEAFATWLEQQGQSVTFIESWISTIDKLQKRQQKEFKVRTGDFVLLLEQDEVQITSTSLLHHEESELQEDFNYYDQESMAGCGLEDFLNLLESWLEFIS